jgi:hypothetical protein
VLSCGSRRKNLTRQQAFTADEVVKAFSVWADTLGNSNDALPKGWAYFDAPC